MSDTDCDQSISELTEKLNKGTFAHFSLVLSCVIFNTPNNALANFVLMYFKQLEASV